MIGRMHHVVIDTKDPALLARFYSELLGLPVTFSRADWVVVADSDHTSGLAFQLAPDHQPPVWRNPARPQQFHLDVIVDDMAEGKARVLALGAQHVSDSVFTDPSGHMFCLVPRPEWAAPVHPREPADMPNAPNPAAEEDAAIEAPVFRFYRHRQHRAFRLVLRRGDAFPTETTEDQWSLSRERSEGDVNADVLEEIRTRGYALFMLGADFSQLPPG